MAESRGTLVVTVRDADCGKVLQGASIILTGECGSCTGISNSEGCVTFSVPTPALINSFTPKPRERPYEAVNLRIVMAGYVTVSIVGEQIFSGETTRQTVMMGALDIPAADGKPMQLERVIVIPEHHLYSASDTPRVEQSSDAELVPSKQTSAVEAMRKVSLPETVRVHLGPPDAEAKTVTVPFRSYVKNVACSELYPTWPEHTLRTNVAGQVSQVLGRLRSKRYPSQGYDFDVTDSPACDQRYVHERGLFDRTCDAVDDYLDNCKR